MSELTSKEIVAKLRVRFDASGQWNSKQTWARAHTESLFFEIDRLLGQLEAAEQHVKILQEQRAGFEPKAAELIERFQQREREAFRLANAATYFVTAERSLHKELLAFMDGQISKPEDYSGFEPPVRHAVTCKLFPDPHDERDPVGPCTCGATSPPPADDLERLRQIEAILSRGGNLYAMHADLCRVMALRSTSTKGCDHA